MSHQTLHPSPLKEGRRILGEKNANACLSPARSPAKQALLNTNSPSPTKKLLPSPSFTARKRYIGQVESEDAVARVLFQEKRVESRHGARDGAGAGGNKPASLSTTTDAMNLDTPEQIIKPTVKEHSSQGLTQQTIPSDPETRKHFIQEKATLLRNRLQSAMRHVRDPQIDRRVSELEEHSRKYPRLSGSGLSSGAKLQQHLEQKYGKDTEEEDDKEDEDMLSTPRAQQSQPQQTREKQREVTRIDIEDEVTPTQTQTTRAEQMALSSPTYNPSAQSKTDDDRPHHRVRVATVATSPSSLLRGEGGVEGTGNGDGDAVDGLLKLMGTNNAAAGATGRV
ncbi:hypothetical protein BDV06DRAFT_235381 [Aspergillus oleicola]